MDGDNRRDPNLQVRSGWRSHHVFVGEILEAK